jgi:hypothetical protein
VGEKLDGGNVSLWSGHAAPGELEVEWAFVTEVIVRASER